MKTTVKNLSDSKYEVTVEVDEKLWIDAQEKARKKAFEKVEVKGFRKGHVPPDIARKHINDGEVINEAINIVLPNAFTKAMEENKLRPILRPTVNVDKFSTSSLTLRFTVIVAPKVTLGAYKDLKIEKVAIAVTEQEIDESVKNVLEQNAELIVKEGAANKGDTVILDFEGFVDGKPFEGGKANNYELVLGSGQFIPGFEDQLIGLKANDKKDVNVKFPENYVDSLKGKDATFKCLIHEVKEKKIPTLNDEAVKDLGLEKVNTVAELREHQKGEILKRKNSEADNAYYNKLVDTICKNSSVSLAPELIAEEANVMKENMKKQIEQNGLTWDKYIQITGQKEEDIEKRVQEDAKRNLLGMLVLNEISEKENITVKPEEIDAEYQSIANQYHMEVNKVKEILSKDLDGFVNQIKSRKLHDLLISLNK